MRPLALLLGLPGLAAAPIMEERLRLPERRGARPIVIAHRGASGYWPEHTLAAYSAAVYQGADFIEPDLVVTRDGSLVARHDNVLDLTTDVVRRPEFAARRRSQLVDGVNVTGWFSEDFTLAEIKRLRAVERIPELRPDSARHEGRFEVPTLEEILERVRELEQATGRPIGVYPETKHPSHFERLGLSMEELLVRALHRFGYDRRPERAFIQSFEVGNLERLRSMTRIPLVQLLGERGGPYDVAAVGGRLSYQEMASAAGLAAIARYAAGVGPEKSLVLSADAAGRLDPVHASAFVRDAHAAGLVVHPYTFRAENAFLPPGHRQGSDPAGLGRVEEEIAAFLAAGIDGFFTDQPDLGVRARDAFLSQAR